MDVIPELSASHMEDDKMRGKNYTAYHKELHLEILKRYPIIEDKGNDNSINNKKQEAWDRVTTEYNSHENFAKRDKANLKSLWKNLKIKAKKDHARHKKEMLKTGGGGPAEPMDKMSEGITDLLPNQFAAIKN
ncbi:myb sant-like DNA-binding domain-containing protein 3 protein [Plakobranchus ocellatus]|uniref:Myb sant-like DNA-binding domain-containing protein 3 protein n=1 Tax=Plakobranchus ocellatus TaxID=259542 RepID=A0AAV3YWV5_9GAST|nr:myb sant-like DNA-binding domain-containing protein 3 protein [Plakobranchus ocellatus]